MTLEEYAAAQAALSAEFVSQALQLATQFQLPTLNDFDWLFFLRMLFPLVQSFRRRSSEIGREIYDSERQKYYPNAERLDMFLGEYQQDWFIKDMEPAKEEFLKTGASDNALSEVVLRAVKNVDNGARTQISRSVDVDPLSVRWARVATGKETCEFCLMMVSRGPVYRSARQAGLDLDDFEAREIMAMGLNNLDGVKALMNRWHPGCDCIAVPVIDRKNWLGKKQFEKAQDLWKKMSKLVDDNPSLKTPQTNNQFTTGNRQWSRSEAVMAAIRRGLYNKTIDMRQYGIN